MEIRDLTPNPFSSCFVEHFLLVLIETWNKQWIAQERSLFVFVLVVRTVVNYQGESKATHLSIRKSDCLI